MYQIIRMNEVSIINIIFQNPASLLVSFLYKQDESESYLPLIQREINKCDA